MFNKKLIAVSIITLVTLLLMAPAVAPQVQAKSSVTIRFAASGLSTYNGVIVNIAGDDWSVSDFGWKTFSWEPGETIAITALPSVTGWDDGVYKFSNWTNGNGLVDNSGTLIVPSIDTTVTMNYELTSFTARFATTGLATYNSQILIVDETTYTASDLGSTTFFWEQGTTHSVEAITPVTGWDSTKYAFSDWTNGNGLTTTQGTFTMPSHDVTTTANYVEGTVDVMFEYADLSNINGDPLVLTIDGTPYTYWAVPQTDFKWDIGSTHTVEVTTPITGWDSVTHYFQNWTNGNGLTGTSGNLTVPASDVTVTANYGLASPSAVTALTIACDPTSIDRTVTNTTTLSGYLTSSGLGVQGKTIALSYLNGAEWTPIVSVTTTTGGAYTYDWTIPASLPNGHFVLKADFAGDSCYEASSAQTQGGGLLFVTPEYTWGIVGLVACLAAFLVFRKVKGSPSAKATVQA
jgi:hypothetical protein